MSQPDASLRAPVAEVLAAIQACVDARGPQTASVDCVASDGLATITVTPASEKAASVTVRMTDEDGVLLTFGRTSLRIAEEAPERIAQLQSTLRLVFAGAFTEYGPGHAQSEFRLADGTTLLVGEKKSSLQRRFGPKHRYEPYD